MWIGRFVCGGARILVGRRPAIDALSKFL